MHTRELALLFFASLAVPVHSQWETSQGGNSRRDGFVDAIGPASLVPGWQVTSRTQFAVQPVVGEGLVVHTRVFDWLSPTGSVIEARDEETGQLVWSATLPAVSGRYDVPYAIRDGKVYAARQDFNFTHFGSPVYALDATDGSLLWESEGLMNTHWDASPSFLTNGDLLVLGPYFGAPNPGNRHLRIDHTDGSTVWTRPRPEGSSAFTAGGAVFQDRYYFVHALGGYHEVVRIDVDDGTRMYASARFGDGISSAAANNLVIGHDGTVYFPYNGTSLGNSELIALEDNFLRERWRVPLAELSLSSLAIAPDGSVLSISPQNEVTRLNPTTGDVLDRSLPLPVPMIVGRIVVDRQSKVFVCAQGSGAAPAQLLAFDADLDLLWTVVLGLSPNTGASLTRSGRLVVSTLQSAVRTFQRESIRPVDSLCAQSARVEFRGGTAGNRPSFFPLDVPYVGRPWRAQIYGYVPSLVGVAFTDAPANGVMTAFGELLVQLSGQRLATLTLPAAADGIGRLGLNVPEDASLCGRVAYGQAFVLGPSGLELGNALDLTFGH